MPNGYHAHYCEKCGKRYECTQITHCKRPDKALCAAHLNDEVNRIAGSEIDRLAGFNAAFERVFRR